MMCWRSKGFRIEETYLKNTLDKLGIGVEVDHIGRFKDAGDLYTPNGHVARNQRSAQPGARPAVWRLLLDSRSSPPQER